VVAAAKVEKPIVAGTRPSPSEPIKNAPNAAISKNACITTSQMIDPVGH